jgi:hypothetical protein
MVVSPAKQVEIYDHRRVAGLKGTGSCNFSVSYLSVLEVFTFGIMKWEPNSGGPLYKLGMPGLVINGHAGFALGVGRDYRACEVDTAWVWEANLTCRQGCVSTHGGGRRFAPTSRTRPNDGSV